MKLPLLVSVPHSGLDIPDEVKLLNKLTEQQIIEDGDEGAAEIYSIRDNVEQFVTTSVARAFVDLNRAPNDFRADGVVKTHTCLDVPVYDRPLSENLIHVLLNKYYAPYHEQLTNSCKGVKLGVDCHTMLAIGPSIGPMAGQERPLICLSNADGTCPDDWLKKMGQCFEEAFGVDVSLNYPFKGGFIIKSHAHELPWMQIEISRKEFNSLKEKRQKVILALTKWCDLI